MAYKLPYVTHKQFRESLAESYGVKFTSRTVAPESPKPFRAMHCSRKLNDAQYETMYQLDEDDVRIDWEVIDNVCRCLHIDYSADGLFGSI